MNLSKPMLAEENENLTCVLALIGIFTIEVLLIAAATVIFNAI